MNPGTAAMNDDSCFCTTGTSSSGRSRMTMPNTETTMAVAMVRDGPWDSSQSTRGSPR